MTNPNYKKHLAYCRGWSDGAGSQPVTDYGLALAPPYQLELYEEGYADGQKARHLVHEGSARRFGVVEREMKLKEGEK